MAVNRDTPKSSGTRIAVALVDDDPHFRLFLESVFGASARHRVVATADSAETAAGWAAGEVRIDVALVDIGLPGRAGPALAAELLAKFPGLLVIMLTARAEPEVILESIRAGAVGYVLKGVTAPEIVAAIDDALAGGAPMSPGIARKVLGLMKAGVAVKPAAAGGDLPALTAREREVLERVAEGASDKEVAERLGVARSTVKNCLLGVYAKWRVSTRTEAAVKFVRGARGAP